MSEPPEETALYHVYGEADLLLYIGISKDFGRRWKDEARDFPWWGEKRRMTTEWYGSRPEAAAAETAAIKTEHPKYNKMHAVKRPPKTRSLRHLSIAPPRPLATAAEVAAYLKMPATKLATLRRQGSGPPCRIIGRSPLYHWEDVEDWLAAHPEAGLRKLLLDALEDAMVIRSAA